MTTGSVRVQQQNIRGGLRPGGAQKGRQLEKVFL